MGGWIAHTLHEPDVLAASKVELMEGMSYRGEESINLAQLRERLRKMSDEELIRFGKAARFMCRDKVPRQEFVIQLNEARAEWRRRKA